jgi:hypothetical protein
MKSWFRAGAKAWSGAIMVLHVIGARWARPDWTPRTALGRQIHLRIFAITLLVCVTWPRPFVIGGVLVAAACPTRARPPRPV